MYATSKGVPIAGTSLYSVAWRTVDSEDDAQAGEITFDALTANACWDVALNTGTWGVRSMTGGEMATASAAMQTLANQRVADQATIAAFLASPDDPGSAVLKAALRLMNL